MSQKIFLASDHGGFKLKEYLQLYLVRLGYDVVDMGNHKLDKTDDYPDFVIPAVKRALKNKSRAIVICRSGVGACIAANKVKGAYAVHADSVRLARQSREHNNTNILCLGADSLNRETAGRVVRTWMTTKFENGRHLRRIRKIQRIEK